MPAAEVEADTSGLASLSILCSSWEFSNEQVLLKLLSARLIMPPISNFARQIARSSSTPCRSFSTSRALAAEVQKLGVVGAGQMVGLLALDP